MEYENKILNLFKNGYLTTKDVNDNNIPRFYLTKLIKENKIERVSRGVYIKKNELVDEFVILQSKSKNAIYSNTTALCLHGFSNRIPIKYDITHATWYGWIWPLMLGVFAIMYSAAFALYYFVSNVMVAVINISFTLIYKQIEKKNAAKDSPVVVSGGKNR